MSEIHGIAARRSLGLCVVIGLMGACATGRQTTPTAQGTPSQSVEHFTEDCTGSNAKRCLALGLRYLEGSGVPKDERRAAALYEKACEGGHAMGCNNLGVLYAKGRGVAQDERRAAALYEKACEGGIAEGCEFLRGAR